MTITRLSRTAAFLLIVAASGLLALGGCQGTYKNMGDGGTGKLDGGFNGAEGIPPGGCNGSDPNACGTCTTDCSTLGTPGAFPTDKSKDPNVKDANGVTVDSNGDLTLGASAVDFNYMWIANTYDMGGSSACGKTTPSNPALCRGTISKVDTVSNKEVARYFTVTCKSNSGASGCVDVNGKTIKRDYNHTPSRTAVDYNFDVWVANRAVFGGQPSATKIASDPLDCIDRNNNGVIDTSKDHDGDGKINIDCDGDGIPDNASTKCSNGKPPEFLGDDDECILFTVNYGDVGDVGRSICLDSGKSTIGASSAWVGTFYRPELGRGKNRFYMLNGYTGKIEKEVEIPAEHHTYGCMADQYNVIWSTDIGTSWYSSGQTKTWDGSLTYFQSTSPYSVGVVLRGGPNKGANTSTHWKDASGNYRHYGISIDGNGHVWLAGWSSGWALRYKPDRSSFGGLAQGAWTRIDPKPGTVTRGIAADSRGKVWLGVQNGGYIWRVDQKVSDGHYPYNGTMDAWPTTASTVIGTGVDFSGNVWAIGHGNNIASRLDVDAKGNVITPATATSKNVTIGQSPYTYSDFTGYGLMTFVRPSGRYIYQMKPCPPGVKATWEQVSWKATTPPGTQVALRVRAGDSDTTFGSWTQAFTSSPAQIGSKGATPVSPNPSLMLQLELTLTSSDKSLAPTLHDVAVSYDCIASPD